MPVIETEILIQAPRERVFDLSRSIEVHLDSTRHTGERVVGGKTSGLLDLGEEVVWEARHLGVKQRLGSCITQFDFPAHFRDSMTSGIFRGFDHDHRFSVTPEGHTFVMDRFNYRSPLGLLGRLADFLFLKAYLRRFLERRKLVIKELAEGEGWKDFLLESEAD